MTHTNQKKLGIDFGKVIISPVLGGREDTTFLGSDVEGAMQSPPAPDAFTSIQTLVRAFDRQAWIVSKAGPSVQRKSWYWLDHWDFFKSTGMKPRNVHFCLERKDKARHCRDLGITHFIDDRLDVLQHLRGLVPHLYLFGEQPDPKGVPDWVVHVKTWHAVLDRVL